MTAHLGTTAAGDPVALDIDRLVSSNLAVLANPGAGKSRTIRRVLELAAGKAQRIVLDVEDEFYTLREASPHLIIAGGDNGDCPATTANAAQLARFILEAGVDAVIQINDLGVTGQQAFVAAFLEAMTSAPKALWHPVLVVLDEAHRLAPESGYSAARDAVVGFITKGRKRGYTAILAAPRNALISKNVTGAVNNWLIGRVGQSTDRAVAADALGFGRSSAEARGLIGLPAGHFWGFGPAIAAVPTLIEIEPSATTHLRPGHRDVPTPPAPEAIRAMMARLAVAPAAETRRDLTESAAAPANSAEMSRIRARVAELEAEVSTLSAALDTETTRADAAEARLAQVAAIVGGAPVQNAPKYSDPIPAAAAPPPRKPPSPRKGEGSTKVSGPQQRILDALGWLATVGRDRANRTQLALLADQSPTSSAYANNLGALRTAGLIDYPSGGEVALTPAGTALADTSGAPQTNADLHAIVRSKVSGPQWRILDHLLRIYPRSILREPLADLAGQSATSSAYANNLGGLRSLGFIDYPTRGMVAALPVLFIDERPRLVG